MHASATKFDMYTTATARICHQFPRRSRHGSPEATTRDDSARYHPRWRHLRHPGGFPFSRPLATGGEARPAFSRMELDIEPFIYEVQQRPAIWDAGDEDYADREKKKEAWEDLVQIFIEGDGRQSGNEKRQFGKQLQRRWKSLRDSYSRELKIQREVESGSGTRKRPVYKFFNQLSFLGKTIAYKETTNSLKEEEEDLSWILPCPIPKKARQKKQDPGGERLRVSAVEGGAVRSREEPERALENDCDRMFLLSLLNPLKQIPQHARFGVKRKLMEVIDAEIKMYYPRQYQFQENYEI